MIALITGASSGLGYEIAKCLSNKGYDIIAVGRNIDRLTNLKLELKTRVYMIPVDLSIPKNVENLYTTLIEKNLNVDILVNNAGIGTYGEFDEIDLKEELEMINLNIIAVDILTKLFLRDMKKKNGGYILNIASSASFAPGPLMSSYYASKAYVYRLTRSIQEELKKDKSNVKVCVACPGPINTDFNSKVGIKFSVKAINKKAAANYIVDKMFKNKKRIVPGFTIKLGMLCCKILPESIISKINYKIQKEKGI